MTVFVKSKHKKNMKSIQITLKDSGGNRFKWAIRFVKSATLIHPDGCLSKSRKASGWEFETNDEVVRFKEGNWLDIVPLVKLTAENYGLTLCSELS